MNLQRNRRVLILSLLLAGVSAFMAYYLIASRPQPAPAIVDAAPVSGEPVLVAARPITAGATLVTDDVEIAYVSHGVKNDRALTSATQAVGQEALVSIPKGEQILATAIGAASLPEPQTFAREVPAGMRAVAIASEETVGVAGFVQPGDRVDVIAGYQLKPVRPAESIQDALGSDDSEGDPFPVAELIVQDVEVLAIGQSLEAGAPADSNAPAPAGSESAEPATQAQATSVTLLVDPAQALRLLLAVEAEGTFRLLLRAPGDTTITELPPALITFGSTEMEPFELIGANLAADRLVITDARFRETSVPGGGVLEFEATVRNVSSQLIPGGRGGAAPGHTYREGETWRSVPELAPEGVYSLAITSAGAETQTYPWRWDLGQDLAPGETATITGGIQVPNAAARQQLWFGIVLQPGTVLKDGFAPTDITIEPVAEVVAIAPTVEVRDAPWPDADVVTTQARGAKADVIDFQDGWFQIRSGGHEGWVPEAAVANAALPVVTNIQAEEETE